METLIKADIFFFVSTIAVVFVTIFVLVLMYYMILSFRQIKKLINKVEENIDNTNIHIKEIVTQIQESFIFNLFFPKKKRRK